MMPWEFVINKPSDLPVFADLLADHRHPGEAVVRHLIANKRFPVRTTIRRLVAWYVLSTNHPEQIRYRSSLPKGSLAAEYDTVLPRQYDYFTRTEAIWAVVNAGKYLPSLTESACKRTSRAGDSRRTSPARRR